MRLVREQKLSELDELLNDRFFDLLVTDRGDLIEAFDSVPEKWFTQFPRHAMTREIARTAGNAFDSLDPVVTARFREWVESQSTPLLRDVIGIRTARLRDLQLAGRLSAASEVASEIRRLLENAEDISGFPDVLPPTLTRVAWVQILAGRLPEALATLQDAYRWSQVREPVSPWSRHVGSSLALVYALTGHSANAESVLAADASFVRLPSGQPAYRCEVSGLFAHLLISLARLDRPAVEEGLREASALDDAAEWWWMLAHVRARSALFWGDALLAASQLEDELFRGGNAADVRYLPGQLLRADLADLLQAGNAFAAAHRILETPGVGNACSFLVLPRARLALLEGQAARAAELLDQVHVDDRAPIAIASIAVLRSSVHHAVHGVDDPGLTGRALTLARREGAADAVVESTSPHLTAALVEVFSATGEVPHPYPAPRVPLSPSEMRILSELVSAPDVTISSISRRLHLATSTVNNHLRSIYRKLGVSTRTAATALAASMFLSE